MFMKHLVVDTLKSIQKSVWDTQTEKEYKLMPKRPHFFYLNDFSEAEDIVVFKL